MDRARLAAFIAIVLWGISFVATKAVLRELAPVPLVFARIALGAPVMLALVALRGERPALDGRAWRDFALLGFLGVFVHLVIQARALTLTSAVHTGWLIGIIPIWVAILAALFLGEKPGPLQVIGFVVGFAGALLIVTRGRPDPGMLALPSTRGDMLILASTLNWAVVTILGRRILPRLGARVATTGALVVGGVLLAPWFLAQGGPGAFAHLSPAAWGALVFLGVGCSGLGYLLWYGALERLEAGQVAVFLYLEPLVTVAAAALWLGESVGPGTLLGGALVLLGVSLVQRRR